MLLPVTSPPPNNAHVLPGEAVFSRKVDGQMGETKNHPPICKPRDIGAIPARMIPGGWWMARRELKPSTFIYS